MYDSSSMQLKPTARPIFSVPLRLLICIVLIVGVGLFTVIAYQLVHNRVSKQTETDFARITDTYTRQLTQRMEGYGDLLYATRGLFATTPITAATWEQFILAQYSFKRYPGMTVIAYAEVVPNEQKSAYTARLRDEIQDKNFTIHPNSGTNEAAVITYLQEDKTVNGEYKGAAGFDLLSEPIRRDALKQARASGQIAATAPLRLVETNKPGFLFILPLANANGTQGYSVAAFDIAALVDKMLEPYLRQYNTAITLTDVTDGASQYLYSRPSTDGNGPMIKRSVTLNVADRRWQLSFETPERNLQMVTDRYAAPAVLVGGIILILTIAIGLYSLRIRNQLRCSVTS